MLREKLLCAQPVVLVYRAQHVTTGYTVPCHHVFIPPGTVRRGAARALSDGAGARARWGC